MADTGPEGAELERGRPARHLALLLAILGFGLDQAHKAWMLHVYDIGERGRVVLTPFFDLVLVWNRGISYGLLRQDGDIGRWLLIAGTLAISAGLAVWMWRAHTRAAAYGLALILGGALANVTDRIVRGAVADFFHLHAGDYSWYVFNLADIWIVAGVGLLLYDSLRVRS